MATTRLTDVFIPTIYGTYGDVPSVELLALVDAGILRLDPVLDGFAEGPSQLATIPYRNDLDATAEPNGSTDNPDDIAVPQKITSGTWIARKAELNNGWSTMDLTRELALADPMPAIKARTSRYWNKQKQRRMLAMALGVMRESIQDHTSDMVVAVNRPDAGALTEDHLIDSDAVIDAAFGMGDRYDSLRGIMMHSVVYKRLVKQSLIGKVPVGDGSMTIPTYLEKPVIVDDSAPVETIAGNKVYTTILFADGAFGFGEGTPTVPVETYRAPDRGNGGGMETLWERKTWLMHPAGYAWDENGATGNAMPTGQPMEANLSNANRWTRVVDRKLVPLAFVRSNG